MRIPPQELAVDATGAAEPQAIADLAKQTVGDGATDVLIAGRNDRDGDADQLARLARPLGALVNLLPLHPGGSSGLVPSDGGRSMGILLREPSGGGHRL